MSPDELLTSLRLSGYSCKSRRDEVMLEVCRFCGNDRFNLEANPEKGVYHCWACGRSGRLDVFLTDLLGSPHHIPVRRGGKRKTSEVVPLPAGAFQQKPATDVESAHRYLLRRGLTDESIRAYGLGVCVEAEHQLQGRITIPVPDFWTGQILGHVGRSYTGKIPKYLSTLPKRMVTGWRVRDRNAPCVLVEGQFDGIAIHRAGYNAAILSGTEAEDVDWFVARLRPEVPLFLMLDGAAASEARRLHARLSPIRDIKLVNLPSDMDPATFSPEVLRVFVEQKA